MKSEFANEVTNVKIRMAAKKARDVGVRYWHIAREMAISPSDFSVMLREELSDDETERILRIIANLSGAGDGVK